MAVNPSKLVIDALYDRLEDSADGFNATYNGLAPDYGLPATVNIDFTSTRSANFVKGDVTLAHWDNSSNHKFPMLALFTRRLVNDNHEKFHAFSGTVFAGLSIFLSWESNRTITDFEAYANAMEETVLTIVNRARPDYPDDQDWNSTLAYNGDVELIKSALLRDGESWVQQLGFLFSFWADVDI